MSEGRPPQTLYPLQESVVWMELGRRPGNQALEKVNVSLTHQRMNVLARRD